MTHHHRHKVMLEERGGAACLHFVTRVEYVVEGSNKVACINSKLWLSHGVIRT